MGQGARSLESYVRETWFGRHICPWQNCSPDIPHWHCTLGLSLRNCDTFRLGCHSHESISSRRWGRRRHCSLHSNVLKAENKARLKDLPASYDGPHVMRTCGEISSLGNAFCRAMFSRSLKWLVVAKAQQPPQYSFG